MDKKYLKIKILIFTTSKNKLRNSLKTHGILKSAENLANFDIKLIMLVKKKFVDVLIKIILDNEYKTRIKSLLCNRTYSFICNIKTTKPSKFSDPEIFYIDKFKSSTSVVMEI